MRALVSFTFMISIHAPHTRSDMEMFVPYPSML